MASYLIRRLIYMVFLLLALSLLAFVLIELPPGDFIAGMIRRMENSGMNISQAEAERLREYYGLNGSMWSRYTKWFGHLMEGELGFSMMYERSVNELIGKRFPLTVMLSLGTLVVTYLIAVPIGVYSATHQYSIGDYTAMTFGFLGLATPNFLLALILMFLTTKYFDWTPGGLFSPEHDLAGWSFAKFVDLMTHLPVPVIVIGTAATAGLIRVLRASLLDELAKQYVITARAKGLGEKRLLIKYPLRVAINPIVSGIGGILPGLVSGETLVAIVMSLPTIGPLLLEALQQQDMYLAGSLVLLLGALGMIGTMVSDVLLVIVDPRIRFEAME